MNLPEPMRSFDVSLATINGDIRADRISIRPNQSLTPVLFARVLKIYMAMCLVVASFSLWQGNVFAPFFAVANVLALAVLFDFLRRSQDREECIWFEGGRVFVQLRRGTQSQMREFDALQLRLARDPSNCYAAILRSSTVELGLGGFLNVEQRRVISARLRELVELARQAALVYR